jgi:methylenetetrahydrofolate reductase (NADPH)
MKSGSNLEKILTKGLFAVTGELDPPKGNDVNVVNRKADLLKGCVDAVNVADNQMAIVRMSSLATSALVAHMELEPIMHMVTRDRNRIALQSDLFSAAAMGIKNVLCMSGVHQSFGNQVDAKNVYDLDSIQLIDCVRTLRDQGTLLGGEEKIEGKVDLFIGAVMNPFADPFEFQAARLAKKIRAGTDFIQTYPIYDIERFKEWMRMVRDRGLDKKVYLLVTLCPLGSEEMIHNIENNFPRTVVPDEIVNRIVKSGNSAIEGVRLCVDQIHEIREIEGIHGIHLINMGWTESTRRITEMSGLFPRPKIF